MTRRSRRLGLLAALALCLAWVPGAQAGKSAPQAQTRHPATFDALAEEGAKSGVDRSRVRTVVAGLRRAGLSPEKGREVLLPAFDAAAAGLPTEPVLDKVEEGILKRVTPDALSAASRRRLAALRDARRLLAAAGLAPSPRRGQPLLVATALALESGVSEPIVGATLRRGRGRTRGQIRSVVEAGEALWLEGLDPAVVEALMADCLSRNLKHQEILHVVRFATEKKREGLDGPAIRDALWSSRRPTRHAQEHPPVTAPAGPKAAAP